MGRDRWLPLAAWVALVAVIAVSAWQVQRLVQQVDDDLANTRDVVCGSWLGTYQLLNVYAADNFPAQEARSIRVRFATDFKARCGSYVQMFPEEP